MVTLDQAGRGAPERLFEPAATELRGRVQHLWVEESGAGNGASRPWRIVSDTCAHLLYHRVRAGSGGELRHRLLLVGPRTVASDVDKRDRLLTAGVRLQPWALPALFGIAASELTDRAAALGDVLGGPAAELEEILASTSAQGVLPSLERWLVPRAARPEHAAERRARCAVLALTARSGSCAEAAADLGITPRALWYLMHEQVGMAPKVFARVNRLHGALHRTAAAGHRPPWARIAADSGYADQAHLAREFRKLLGEPPGRWVARATDLPSRGGKPA